MSEYKDLYNSFKQDILNEDNRDQIIFLCSRKRHFVKVAEVISKKTDITKREMYLARIYILVFHYRLIEYHDKTQENGIEDVVSMNQIQLELVNKVSTHFNLTSEETHVLKIAFEDATEPIKRKSPRSIKLGHDAIVSILFKKNLIKRLNTLFSELEFYFPALGSQFTISSSLVDYIAKTKYYSSDASEKYLSRKIKNKKALIEYIQKQKDDSSLLSNKQAMTIIKTSSRNQVDLISIADKKAGIMITVNSILLTLLIPMFASYLFDFSRFIVPISILTVTCGLTILLATLATRPSLVKGKVTSENIQSGQKSIFYFKNFSRLDKSDFTHEVRNLITKSNSFEQSVFTDLYDVGVNLDVTFKRLRWCYTIFGAGILLTMITFLLCIAFVSI